MNLFKRTTATVALVALVSSVFTSGVSAYSVAELNAAAALAAKGYINTQTDASGYQLDATITRAEIAKVAANVAELDAMASCEGKFADVSATTPNDWVCGYVEALLANGLVSANANYNPNDNLTKAEAVKLMLTVAGEEVSYGADWQADFVAYAVENGFVSNFSDYNTAATRGFVFSVAAAATTEEEGDDILSELDKLLGGDDEETTTEEEDDTTTVVSGDSALMVELSPETPNEGFVAAARDRTPVLAVEVSAGSEDATLKDITIEYVGLSDSDDINNVSIYLNNNEIVKSAKNISTSDNEVELTFENDTVIKAGETKTLIVTANVASATGNVSHKLAIVDLDASVDVEMDNVTSNSFGVVNSDNVAELKIDIDTQSTDVVVGEVETFADFSLEERQDKEDVMLKSLTFEFDAFDAEDDLSDLVLLADGEVIASNLVVNSDDEVIVDLDFTIPADEKVDFELEGIVTGSINDTVELALTDVYAVGAETGLLVSFDVSGDSVGDNLHSGTRTIEGSEINISFDKSDVDEAKPNAEEVLVGTLKIESVSDYTIDELEVTVTSSTGVTALVDNIELDGKSYDKEAAGVYTFTDITLKAGESRELDLTFDIVDDTALNSEDVTFALEVTAVTDEENDEEYDTPAELAPILSSTTYDDHTIDVETASITLTQTTVTQRELVLGNGVEVVLYKGKINVGDSDDVTIEDVVFTGAISRAGVDMEDLFNDVELNIGGKTFEGDVNSDNIEFTSINAVVEAGSDNVEVTMTAVLSDDDTIVSGDTAYVDNVELTVEDSEGDDLVSGNVTVNVTASDTTLVLNENGSLEVAVINNGENEDEIETSVLAGTSNVALAELEIEADEENITIEDLAFTGAGDFSTTLSNVRIVAGSTTLVEGAVVTHDGGVTTITFEKEFTVEDSSEKIEALLVADLEEITTEGGEVTAITGDLALALDVSSAKIKGVNSNDDITPDTTDTVTSEAVTVVPALVTVSVLDELGTNDSDALIKFTIDKGNNDLDSDDVVITNIEIETAVASGLTIRNDDNETLTGGTTLADIDLSLISFDLTKINNNDEYEFSVEADNDEVRIVKEGITYWVDLNNNDTIDAGEEFKITNDKVIDLGEYDAD